MKASTLFDRLYDVIEPILDACYEQTEYGEKRDALLRPYIAKFCQKYGKHVTPKFLALLEDENWHRERRLIIECMKTDTTAPTPKTEDKIKMLLVKKETLTNSDGTYQAGSCTIRVVNIAPELDAYYAKLNCRCIDIQERNFGGVPFDCICDDEACCYNTPPVKTVKSKTDSRYDLCNTLLICKSKNGEPRSMTAPEIAHIKAFFNPMPRINAMQCD